MYGRYCSTNGSRDILRRMDVLGVAVFFHERNRGKGAAVRTVLDHASGDYVIIQGADLEYDPTEYPKLMGPILEGEADIVYGSRFRSQIREMTLT